MSQYPNLSLIEERFKNAISKEIREKKEQEKQEGKSMPIPHFSAIVFPETFSNTAGVFCDVGTVSGQAMTEQYITVMHESLTDIYAVFGDDRLAYVVEQPSEAFFEDLDKRQIRAIGEARTAY